MKLQNKLAFLFGALIECVLIVLTCLMATNVIAMNSHFEWMKVVVFFFAIFFAVAPNLIMDMCLPNKKLFGIIIIGNIILSFMFFVAMQVLNFANVNFVVLGKVGVSISVVLSSISLLTNIAVSMVKKIKANNYSKMAKKMEFAK